MPRFEDVISRMRDLTEQTPHIEHMPNGAYMKEEEANPLIEHLTGLAISEILTELSPTTFGYYRMFMGSILPESLTLGEEERLKLFRDFFNSMALFYVTVGINFQLDRSQDPREGH